MVATRAGAGRWLLPENPDFEAEGLLAGVDESGLPARLKLLEWLLDAGVKIEDLKAEAAADRLAMMPADLVLGAGRNRYTPRDIAAESGLEVNDFLRLIAALGFPRPAPDQRSFDDNDLGAAIRLRRMADGRDPDRQAPRGLAPGR